MPAEPALTYYSVLGVAQTATLDEIRAAYRTRISQHHPDRDRSAHAHTISALINEAWETLSDRARRQEYDASLEVEPSPDVPAGASEAGHLREAKRRRGSWWKRVVGHRDDFPPATRNRHRLAGLGICVCALITLPSLAVLLHTPPALTAENVQAVTDLHTYTMAHPDEANTIPGFSDLGIVADRAYARVHPGFWQDGMCSTNLRAHPAEVAAFFNKHKPNASRPDMTPTDALALLPTRGNPILRTDPQTGDTWQWNGVQWVPLTSAPNDPGPCLFYHAAQYPTARDIVVYQYMATALIAEWLSSTAMAALVIGVATFTLLNIYYRGIAHWLS